MAITKSASVGDLMATEPIVVRADAPLAEAAALIDHHHVSGLPVVDGAGSLVGVISQTDLMRARATEHLWANWPGLAVRHLMSTPAVTVHRDTSILEAAQTMERLGIHRLVVVADHDELLPVGVISVSDIVRSMTGEEPSRG
jgi:CBS domain-containing protein